jgi:hypothetical protein
MARRALGGLLVLLAAASLLPGDPGTGQPAAQPAVVPARLAAFSAASVQVKGDTLTVTDLQEIDPKATGQDLAGRVLLGGGGSVKLGLWALKVGADMARATPFLGQEGPGGSVLGKPGTPAAPQPNCIPFKAPVGVTLTELDAGGLPCRTRQVWVCMIRLAGDRP